MDITFKHLRNSQAYEATVRATLKRAANARHSRKGTVVAIVFVRDAQMRAINHEYRGKDQTTNVLAFPCNANRVTHNAKNATRYTLHATRELDLGDIFISLPEAKREAKKYGWTVRYAVARLTLHGFLHLLGYDHVKDKEARVMEMVEKKVLVNF